MEWVSRTSFLFFLFYPISSSLYDEVFIRIEGMKKRIVEINGVSFSYSIGYSKLDFEELKEMVKDRDWFLEGKEYAGFLNFYSPNPFGSPITFYLFIKGKSTRVIILDFRSMDEVLKIGRFDGMEMKFEKFLVQLSKGVSDGPEFSTSLTERRWKALRRDKVDNTEFRLEYEE